MRTSLCLVVTLLLLGSATVAAHADSSDFRTHVLDPISSPFPTNPVTSTVFTLQFGECHAGELPGGMTASGCFAGVNRTGLDWTDLQFIFPDTDALGGQPVSCALAPSDNIFLQPACGLNPDTSLYTLNFAGGVLQNNALFFVTEDGVPFADFPTGTATVLATTSSVSPEPGSFLLLGTGTLLLAALALRRVA